MYPNPRYTPPAGWPDPTDCAPVLRLLHAVPGDARPGALARDQPLRHIPCAGTPLPRTVHTWDDLRTGYPSDPRVWAWDVRIAHHYDPGTHTIARFWWTEGGDPTWRRADQPSAPWVDVDLDTAGALCLDTPFVDRTSSPYSTPRARLHQLIGQRVAGLPWDTCDALIPSILPACRARQIASLELGGRLDRHCPTCRAELYPFYRQHWRPAGQDQPVDTRRPWVPPHRASARCQSGGHPHCTCGACW